MPGPVTLFLFSHDLNLSVDPYNEAGIHHLIRYPVLELSETPAECQREFTCRFKSQNRLICSKARFEHQGGRIGASKN